MQTNPKSNKPAQPVGSPALKRVRKSLYKQALLAGLMIVLTIVVLFAVTAAWYTNIVQTNGLVFEAATWGFDGTVTLESGAIRAAPGDEGVIGLTAQNDSELITAVGVNISKADMQVPMQQRIYFYVDAPKTRSEESMERVYLNNAENYTYTLFSHGTLNLGETVYNDAQLKWQWVYDVLGYYVQGSWDGSTMIVTDYLRPIEYSYDEAETTFDADGELATIDGTTTAAQFLRQLSQSDGYPGTIVASNKNSAGYYPVSVDANGNGVWAYLCTYSEIMANTAYDTQLGESAGDGWTEQYVATITISAQNTDVDVTEVSTAAALTAAIDKAALSGQTAVIRLADHLTLTDALELDRSNQVMLDLNGYAMQVPSGTYSAKAGGIQMEEGSCLTVTNGVLTGTNGTGHVITANGAEITLSSVTVENAETVLYIRDDNGSADSLIRLVDCDLTTSEETVYLSGNGSASAQMTRLIVEHTTIDSGYIGIMGNGNSLGSGQWGTDIQIIDSYIYGRWAGIYQPQKDSVLTVSGGSTITGYTGLALKGGTTCVLDSTVSATGSTPSAPAITGSGFTDTADGIYIETGYGYEILLEITNSTVESETGYAVQVYEPNTDDVNVKIYSGKFSTDVSAFLAAASTQEELDTGYYRVSEAASD